VIATKIILNFFICNFAQTSPAVITMSKRKAADVLQPESSAPSSRNVLELFVRDHDAKTIRNVFIRTLQQSNSTAFDNLLTAMEAAGFDFSSTRAVFALPKSLHCVR
jgi:hypothetical protein